MCSDDIKELQASGQIITYLAIHDLKNYVAHTFYTFSLGAQKCPDTCFSQVLVNLSKSVFLGKNPSGRHTGWY